MTTDALYHKIRKLIGQRFDYLDEIWILVEVLADDDSVVLRRCTDCGPRRVQSNVYGMPTRRVDDNLTLPISDGEGGYSQDLLVLLEGRRSESAG